MTDKQIKDGKECRYWFRPNPCDYRKCSLRSENDNCDEIKDCFVKELLGKLALKEQECDELKKQLMQKSEVDMFFNTPIEGWSSDSCGVCKYKNFLTEIKDIAEEDFNHTCWETYARQLKQILQKISEVENDNA